jgi:hypothetical protein
MLVAHDGYPSLIYLYRASVTITLPRILAGKFCGDKQEGGAVLPGNEDLTISVLVV